MNTAAGARLFPIGAAQRGKVAIDSFVWRIVAVDDVNHATDRVAPIKQRRRSLHDFHAVDREQVDRFSVVSRLRTQRTYPRAVLEDEHAISVKAANYRSRWAGTEGPF